MVLPSGNEELFRKAMNQGHSAAWEGRWQQAVEHYSRALKEFPENPPVLNSLALAQFELGHLDQALELYQRAARFAPEDPLPIEKTAEIYKQMGQISEAVDYSRRAAELYVNMRDADKAINNWTRVVRLDPENVDAHSRLALVYERLGRIDQAITEHIAVASLLQAEGKLEQAEATGEHALQLDSKNQEAQNAVEMLRSFKSLPKPVRASMPSGPLKLPDGKQKKSAKNTLKQAFEEGPDPLEEASQKALQALAAMLFDLTPSETEKETRDGGLRSIARVVADGLMSRGFDEKKIAQQLSKAIEFQSQKKNREAAEELKLAIEAGLDHPAAHFNLGVLLSDQDRRESAQRSFQRAVKHADYGLAARLIMADYLADQDRKHESVAEYLQALRLADLAVVSEEQAEGLKQAYEPLIEAASNNDNEAEIDQLCQNIRHLLVRSNWRSAVSEARSQLPQGKNGVAPIPLADILTQANSGRLVDAMARISHLAREGFLRAAIEEGFTALDFAPNYLPLHISMGELMLMQEHPQLASDKFGPSHAFIAPVGKAIGLPKCINALWIFLHWIHKHACI
ncbi:MAG: tetratricopeptide repeat protein [Chloroflexi bacterium]|nr:tetratricopeptide repeat protein [Chloroflexota bacterium]